MRKRAIRPAQPKAKRAKPPAEQTLSRKQWANRCAWCAGQIKPEEEMFGITIALHPQALKELERDTIQPLFLPGVGRSIPMIILPDDSPAKRDGKDAAFQLCSRSCAEALQNALKMELGD
ncbi:MAG: hypothetical protein AB1705_08065 [Verrucomicrobiota bacterium]